VTAPASNPLTIQLLGAMRVLRGGEPIPLPASRKTRALLAYLALTGREHSRDRLCSLLWPDVDDPRGALRWSLSRLRPVACADGRDRLVATRETVRFDAHGADVDALSVVRLPAHPRRRARLDGAPRRSGGELPGTGARRAGPARRAGFPWLVHPGAGAIP